MQAVKSKNTAPELLLRKMLHAQGYRYRLHRRDLPGSPDLVFLGRKKVIFVHGCFWHGHDCPRGSRVPKANRDYWKAKIAGNRVRDATNQATLASGGWGVLTVWECELRDAEALRRRITGFLGEVLWNKSG